MATRDARHAGKGLSPRKVALSARWVVCSVAPLVWLLISAPVHAAPIGVFSWSEYTQDQCDTVDLCGAFFFVGNFSTDPDISLGALGDTFFNVSVDLQTDTGPTSLSLGNIAPGGATQSTKNLFGTTIATAALTLSFGLPGGLPGSIQLLDEFGNVVPGLTAPGSLQIDFAASEPAPVPEPSTLLLLTGGLSLLARARRERPRLPARADPSQRSGESQ